jgi:hypothetical protein
MNDNSIKVMKLNVLDAHDRLLELKKTQSDILAKGAEDCLKRNPDSLAIQERCPYVYLFAHVRTKEDGSTKRMLWQPRITRPSPQTNSYLFRALSKTDTIEICWMIPAMETWANFRKGNIAANAIVEWSIGMYLHNKNELKKAHPDDLSDERAKTIFMQIGREKENRKMKPILP